MVLPSSGYENDFFLKTMCKKRVRRDGVRDVCAVMDAGTDATRCILTA
jgi:hypothetical protein